MECIIQIARHAAKRGKKKHGKKRKTGAAGRERAQQPQREAAQQPVEEFFIWYGGGLQPRPGPPSCGLLKVKQGEGVVCLQAAVAGESIPARAHRAAGQLGSGAAAAIAVTNVGRWTRAPW